MVGQVLQPQVHSNTDFRSVNQQLAFSQASGANQVARNSQVNLGGSFPQQQFLASFDQHGNIIQVTPQLATGNYLTGEGGGNQLTQVG